MSALIRLRYPAICSDCGERLEPGTLARYYGLGNVYGREGCHQYGEASLLEEVERFLAEAHPSADPKNPDASAGSETIVEQTFTGACSVHRSGVASESEAPCERSFEELVELPFDELMELTARLLGFEIDENL